MANETILINDDLRTMQIPSSITLLGVESDDDVNVIPFQMPKEYCGFDLSTFEVRINYMNANGIGDIYIADDLEVDGDDPSLMNFTWLVGRNACAYKGNTQFIVCLKKFDENQVVVQEFNTTVYSLPVLQGLETTEAVEQQNADIIEYLLNVMSQSGTIDPNNYYTKAQVDALIPTELPNPEKLIINGTEYDGSEEVELTIEATSEVLATASGALIHVADAIPQAVEELLLYDSNDDGVASASIAVTNKNLFRIDLLGSSVTSKGITFTKDSDGGVTVSGTSTDTYAMTTCNLDKNMFVVGQTYTVSSGKTSGYSYVQLIMNYTDNSVDYIVARNSARTFTISKAVASCVASVQITDSGVTVSNEKVYPQLEVGNAASSFVLNTYSSMTFTGSTMPVLPAAISNLWSNSDTVANIVMQYEADSTVTKINTYAQDANFATKEAVYASVDEYMTNNPADGDLSEGVKQALLACFEHVAWIDAHGQDYLDALETALYPPANLVSISASFDSGGTTIYNTATLDDLKQYLTVLATYDDSTSEAVTNYTLTGTVETGTCSFTVLYGGKTASFTVNVVEWLTSITAVYTQSGDVYEDTALTDLKDDLVVTANYADSTSAVISDYTLTGTLAIGTSTITATYAGKTATFTVTVSQPDTSIYNWDFRSSLTDTKQQAVATIGSGVTQNASGLTFDGTVNAIAYLADMSSYSTGQYTVELDVTTFNAGAILLSLATDSTMNTKTGIRWSGGKWNIYDTSNNWKTPSADITDSTIFNGKTLKFQCDYKNATWSVYSDNTLLFSASVYARSNNRNSLGLGTSNTIGDNLIGIGTVITGCRIYEGIV